MAKVVTNITLKDGTNETTFINDVTSNTEVELKNRLPNTPTIVVLKVEESYLDTLKGHASVVNVEVPPPIESTVTYPSVPAKYTVTGRRVTGYESPSDRSSIDGRTCLSYTHYYDTDLMVSDDLIGSHGDDSSTLLNQTYSNNYTGKNVDLIIFESGSNDVNYNAYSDHPEFDNPDNTGNSRAIKINWPNLEDVSNNQVSNGRMWDDHSVQAASVAAGLSGGLAKKANIYTVFITVEDTAVEIIDAIKGWHTSKGNNSSTGIPNPTILCTEWSYFSTYHKTAIKCEDIDSITYPNMSTANRPGSGWGSDLTPFVERNMIPFQLIDPTDNTWHWAITFPRSDQSSSLKTAVDGAVDAGILYATSYGNHGFIGVKETHAAWNGGYCTTSGSIPLYNLDPTGSALSISKTYTTSTTHYKFRSYGDGGLDKALVVAAGQNSAKYPTLDAYSGRGPGVDVVGRGVNTFSIGTLTDDTWQDGNKWGTFGGNSCAVPTICGMAACMMEEYYTLHGAWPSPQQVKDILVAESRNDLTFYSSVPDWSNTPTASDTNIIPTQSTYSSTGHVKLKHGESQRIRLIDQAGTANRKGFLNAKGFNREQTYKKRPLSGVLFPRPRKFDLDSNT